MATSNKIRALNRLPFDFQDGLKIGGVDVTQLKELSTSAGASKIGYMPAGGGVATTVESKLRSLELSDYTALRAFTGTEKHIQIVSPGIAGLFYYDPTDTTSADNGGTIIVASNGKRWKRIFDGTVFIGWFGVVGDGIADDTSAFLKVISYCKILGVRRLCLGGLKYKLTQRITIDFSDFVIDGKGSTIVWAGVGLDSLNTGIFQFIGSLSGTSATVTVNSPEYSTSLIVNDVTGFSVGDVIQIDSASTLTPGIYVNVTARITSIVGLTIYTDVTRRLALTISEYVSVTKLNAVQRSGIFNCDFVATGQISRSNGIGGVFFQYTANCFSKNLTFNGFWFKGVKTQFGLNTHISSIVFRNPAATNGGEGYAVQFEYAYNSIAEKVTGIACRHTVDVTASCHIRIVDCFDSEGKSASFLTHTAYEYDIVFDRCTSQGNSADGAFAMGALSGEFADTTDQVTISNCTVLDCAAPVGISYRNKGSGLRISNTQIQMRSGVTATAVAVGNANIIIENCELVGGLRAESDIAGGAFNSGDILVSNTIMKGQDSQRALLLLDGHRVRMTNSSCEGLVQVGNGKLFASNSKMIIKSGTTQYMDFIGTINNTGEFIFNSCTFDPSLASSSARNFYGNLVSIIDGTFVSEPNGQPTNIYAKKFIFNENKGVIRLNVLSGVLDVSFSGNSLDALLGTTRIFNASGFTGKLVAIGNILQSQSVTNGCFIVSSSNLLDTVIFANNFVKGVVVILEEEVQRANVSGNVVNGSVTYPVPGAQKIITNNVSY